MILFRVTPALAKQILEHCNGNNRALRITHVDSLAEMMEKGHWPRTGAAIQFDVSGQLIDGQHRLAAVVKADMGLDFWISLGNPLEAYKATDRNIPKNFADDLRRDGETNCTALSATARILIKWNQGCRSSMLLSGTKDCFDLSDIVEHNPELRDAVAYINPNKLKLPVAPRILSFVRFMTHRINAPFSDRFFEKLFTGEGLIAGDPVLALRNKFLATSRDARAKDNALAVLSYFIMSWNHARKGRKVTKLQLSTRDVGERQVVDSVPEFV